MTGFVLRALISAIGLWIATYWVSGIRIDDAATLDSRGRVVGNHQRHRPTYRDRAHPADHDPVARLLSSRRECRAWSRSWPASCPGFHIPGGFWSAFGTALIVWITSWIGSWLIGPRGKIDVYVRKL